MSIRKPGGIAAERAPLRAVRMRARGARRALDRSIALIPFIDFLLVLVIFLLVSFGRQAISHAELELPDATHIDSRPEYVPLISIRSSGVMLGDERVADARALAENANLETIAPLVGRLETMRTNWQFLHPGEAFRGGVIIAADREVDYRVVRKVMHSAAVAGYADLSFAVDRAD